MVWHIGPPVVALGGVEPRVERTEVGWDMEALHQGQQWANKDQGWLQVGSIQRLHQRGNDWHDVVDMMSYAG